MPSPYRAIVPRNLKSALFPNTPRNFPFRRSVRIGLRTVHIFTSGTLLGGYIFQQPLTVLEPWLLGSIISGLLLFATDLYASASILFELSGLAVISKLVLLAILPFFWDARISLLVIILVIGSVSSHLPKRYRHRILYCRHFIIPEKRRK